MWECSAGLSCAGVLCFRLAFTADTSHSFWEVVQTNSNSTLGIAEILSHRNPLCSHTWGWITGPPSPYFWSSGFGLCGKACLRLLAAVFLLEEDGRAVRFLISAERGGGVNPVACFHGKLSWKMASLDTLGRSGGICCPEIHFKSLGTRL